MPSPIFHSVAGYALSRLPLAQRCLPGRLSGRLLSAVPVAALYGIVVSNVPDLDFIPQVITGLRFHRGPSHSLLGAVLVSALLAFMVHLINRRDRRSDRANNPLIALFILTLIFYGVHLLLDLFSAGGNGMRLLWPLSEQFFKSPIALFPQVHYDRSLWDASHLRFIGVELLYSLGLLGTLKMLRARRKARKHSTQRDISSHSSD
jgi:inner membrane protein